MTKPRGEVVGAQLADLLATLGLQPSMSAARRLIKVCTFIQEDLIGCAGACIVQDPGA